MNDLSKNDHGIEYNCESSAKTMQVDLQKKKHASYGVDLV
jgi:hypothetical protein